MKKRREKRIPEPCEKKSDAFTDLGKCVRHGEQVHDLVSKILHSHNHFNLVTGKQENTVYKAQQGLYDHLNHLVQKGHCGRVNIFISIAAL